jgi:hypothetical protein
MISKATKCTGRNVVWAIRCRLTTYFHSEDYWYYSDGVYEVPESHTQTDTHIQINHSLRDSRQHTSVLEL